MKKWSLPWGLMFLKNTLDIHCAELNQHIMIKNGTEGFLQLIKWCKCLRLDLKKSFVVLEYTGGYEYKLLQFCESRSISIYHLKELLSFRKRLIREKCWLQDYY